MFQPRNLKMFDVIKSMHDMHDAIRNITKLTLHNYLDSWMSYFDLSIVDARKPKFFDAGTKFQYIDTNTGNKL